MLDYLLQYDEEDDAEFKEKMIKMLENMDTYESGINVLETYITKDIGKNFGIFTPSPRPKVDCFSPPFLEISEPFK